MNLYGYTGNDPVNKFDPSGNSDIENFFRQLFGVPSGQFEAALHNSVDNTPTDVRTSAPSTAISALGEMAVGTATGITYAAPEVALTAVTGGPGGRGVAQGSKTLFRVVSKAELDDIAKFGGYRITANSLEGKQFVNSLPDAERLQKALQAFFGNADAIVKTKAPVNVVKNADKRRVVDAGGTDTVTIKPDDLDKLCEIEVCK